MAAMADFPSVTQSRFYILPGIAGRPETVIANRRDDVGATAPATDQDRRLRGRCGVLGTGAGSGVQPAIVRAHSRALALSVMPGNSRHSSTAADNSPPCS